MDSRNTQAKFVHEVCKQNFDTAEAAQRYSTRHVNSSKGQRERNCIEQALGGLEKNALILDLPCGTGRLSYYIKNLGYRVVGADYSEYMLVEARKLHADIRFEQQDVMAIKHADNEFAATVCNRLFHHYPLAETRRAALRELARVTKGPIIISFFNSYSISAIWSKLKNFVLNKKPADRLAISYHTFKADVEACGLKIVGSYFTKMGISPQTYVKVVKK